MKLGNDVVKEEINHQVGMQRKKTMHERMLKRRKYQPTGNALFLFSSKSKLRKCAATIVQHSRFEGVILLLIIISSVFLAIENPLDDPNSQIRVFLERADQVMTTLFLIELVLKNIAYGFVMNGKTSYLRTFWNVLDFCIVLFSLLSIFADSAQLRIIKTFRLLRLLRPLRVISRNQGLKVAVLTLIMAIPNIMNVFLVSLVFYLVFSLFFVQFLRGAFYHCVMDQVSASFVGLIENKHDCVNFGGAWINQDSNFDNAITGMFTLFEIATVGFIRPMFRAVDATQIDKQPRVDNSPAWIIPFVGFIIVGKFFILNLFVGEVVKTFNYQQDRAGKDITLTEAQRDWLQIKLLVLKSKPFRKTKENQGRLARIVQSKQFEIGIFICIVANTIVMGLEWYREPEILDRTKVILNYFFAGVFTVEAILKIKAFGRGYFKDSWNIFDFTIVIGTLAAIVIELASST